MRWSPTRSSSSFFSQSSFLIMHCRWGRRWWNCIFVVVIIILTLTILALWEHYQTIIMHGWGKMENGGVNVEVLNIFGWSKIACKWLGKMLYVLGLLVSKFKRGVNWAYKIFAKNTVFQKSWQKEQIDSKKKRFNFFYYTGTSRNLNRLILESMDLIKQQAD